MKSRQLTVLCRTTVYCPLNHTEGQVNTGRIIGQLVWDLGVFVRFALLGGTLVIVLLGAGSAAGQVSAVALLWLVLGATGFHNFTYVLNDLIDLPIDRTEPRRAESPLVRGTVQPWQAALFMLLQIPIPFVVTAVLGGGWPAYGALAAAFLLMAIYDIWGKSTVPLLTDFAQGVSWGCLGLWAALAVGGQAPLLTWVLFAYLIVYIILINGVHGSLRDLPNDSRYGVRSTAAIFGARVEGEGIYVPQRLKQYTRLLQLLLWLIISWSLFENWFGYRPLVWGATVAVEVVLALLCWRWLNRALAAAGDRQRMLANGGLHLMAAFAALVVLFWGYVGVGIAAVLTLLFIAPMLTHAWIRRAIGWRVGGSAVSDVANLPSVVETERPSIEMPG